MDVTSEDDVQQGVKKIIEESGQIDILLSNAGYGLYGPVEDIDMEQIRYQYEVNVFGAMRVVRAVLPQMRLRRSGRIIITTSLVAHMSTMGLGWYASTKHALKALGTALRQELKHLNIDVVMIEPGAVKTEFGSVALDTLQQVKISDDYRQKMQAFRKYVEHMYEKSPDAESTAECMLRAITDKRPKTVYRTTRDARFFPLLLGILPDRMIDFLVSFSMKAGKRGK